ncbi:MAG: hypothetical protein ABR600_10765 [Actinomycetota bacterium]
MFARVAIYEVPGHRIDEVVEGFRAPVGDIVKMGAADVFVLVSPENDRALTMTMWEHQHDMEASRLAATRLRSEAVDAAGGTIQSVVEYEVAIHESGTT